ncbi:hypothetical protein HPB52_015804 [Rhipicephalus sanguineus]|uniref:RING-type domain-containing protein n=1 Tax=Rhipicephalus sanguineus TaxID=34632 RepID=A0A9D4T5R5_RHISA|nr:hypothetical protein HPB52_015804 [Rhipicephalus sanguineus]
MQDSGRAHRFCDHAVAGVSWRPTRFVDEVPTSRVCGLCHMIPNRILVLPCGHLLCQSCHTAISQGVGGRCPLDEEPFDQAECGSYDLPTRTASAMKVYCWNEAHGCQFEGTMEDILRHFEKECTFQTAECLRCGEVVLRRELSTHYLAGCTTLVCSARTQNTSPESTAPSLQDVIASPEEVKTLFRDSGKGEHPTATENAMNELADESGNHESTSIVAPRGVEFYGMLEGSQCSAPSLNVHLYGVDEIWRTALECIEDFDCYRR